MEKFIYVSSGDTFEQGQMLVCSYLHNGLTCVYAACLFTILCILYPQLSVDFHHVCPQGTQSCQKRIN